MTLKPRRFDWLNGQGSNIAGFIAQEVQTVLSDLVVPYKLSDTETKLGLRMGDMIPTLVKEDAQVSEAAENTTQKVSQEKRKKKKKTSVAQVSEIPPSVSWYANPTTAMILVPLAVIGLVVFARRAMS